MVNIEEQIQEEKTVKSFQIYRDVSQEDNILKEWFRVVHFGLDQNILNLYNLGYGHEKEFFKHLAKYDKTLKDLPFIKNGIFYGLESKCKELINVFEVYEEIQTVQRFVFGCEQLKEFLKDKDINNLSEEQQEDFELLYQLYLYYYLRKKK